MSVHVSSDVWRHSKAKGAALLVLLSLADQANDEGQCWPKVDAIAQRCRISRASVHRHLDQLRELGEVDWIDRRAEKRGSVYTITVGFQVTSQSETSEPARRLNGETSDVSAVSHLEPSVETSVENTLDVDHFAAFWRIYPKRVARTACEAKYKRLTTGRKPIDPTTINQGALRFAQAMRAQGTEQKYIAAPLVWLNQGRWEDELPDVEQPRTEGFGW